MTNKHRNDDGTISITLKHPIQLHNKTVAEVTLRTEVTVADLEAMDKGKGAVGSTIHLIAELSGLSPSTVKRMIPSDYFVVSSATDAILAGNDPLETGETS